MSGQRWNGTRIVGTAVLATATAVPLAMGYWSAWVFLFRGMPMPIGFLALAGALVAPVFLVRDIVLADRHDRKIGGRRGTDVGTTPPEAPVETMD